ncbi:TIGR01620 family protein [Photobacterium damselae subsp. damselae]|uniref:YcjF family protein n=1 Tax=Photobacterium damselae TaxID=38293 RepID=UPI000A2FA506|nr:TIGR01620 family protein [Photobacterium damselae]ARR49546.1 TIGR01620 family protein [Photobacterium damselae subsp. damselae]QAY35911.1 TIGR01620 family protein [Photobacterium damselae subsp. damselae]QOQ69599.1 TIGR01620 family protein [Photobacterium damselae subsp. damselae]
MSEQYKSKILFDESSPDIQTEQEKELTSQISFDEDKKFLPKQADNTEIEQELDQILASKPKRRGGFFKGLLLAGAAMVGWQSVDYVVTAYQSADWLSLGWSVLVAGIATMGITALGRELLNLRRLKHRQTERDQAQELLNADGIGNGKAFCTKLAKQSQISTENTGYDRWIHSLAVTHNDREVMALYDKMVVSQQDKMARQLVARYSSEAAVMVALSPLAIADMLLVAWRNFRLIEQVSNVYGVELGYWSRIRLVKLVLANMAFAGASEIATDIGTEVLSMDLAGRMSTRVAQGVGIGLLTGRLGLKAITLMRPLPWLPGEQPKLSEIRHDLIAQLTKKKDH